MLDRFWQEGLFLIVIISMGTSNRVERVFVLIDHSFLFSQSFDICSVRVMATKTRKIPQEEWDLHKETILSHYLTSDLALDKLVQVMDEVNGFSAT